MPREGSKAVSLSSSSLGKGPCFPGERPLLLGVEHLYPAVFPQSPEELGDMMAPGSGPPRKPHLTVLPCPPMSQASGRESQVHCSTTAMCWQPEAKWLEEKVLGSERSGECGGLMPAAPLTISLWLLELAGKFQYWRAQHRS